MLSGKKIKFGWEMGWPTSTDKETFELGNEFQIKTITISAVYRGVKIDCVLDIRLKNELQVDKNRFYLEKLNSDLFHVVIEEFEKSLNRPDLNLLEILLNYLKKHVKKHPGELFPLFEKINMLLDALGKEYISEQEMLTSYAPLDRAIQQQTSERPPFDEPPSYDVAVALNELKLEPPVSPSLSMCSRRVNPDKESKESFSASCSTLTSSMHGFMSSSSGKVSASLQKPPNVETPEANESCTAPAVSVSARGITHSR